MTIPKLLSTVALALALSGCGTYATSSVSAPGGAAAPSQPAPANAGAAKKAPEDVIVTERDITDRRYTVVGDISVTVRKFTLFDADPTREKVARSLQEKAAELGADAVVLTRYGTVGIGLWSWGQMDGQGRAIRFQ